MKPFLPRRAFVTLASTLAAAALLAACGSSGDDGSGKATGTSGDSGKQTDTVKIGVVPGLGTGFFDVGVSQGYFADAGIKLEITPVDSGPNVVTGVVSGQYDLGDTAYAPPLLAYAQSQPLRLVTPLGSQSKAGLNGGVVVKKDSGIKSWKDLAGKKIGVNAPRSLGVLWIQGAIEADGGKAATPDSLQLVPLPFNQIADQVANGQIDAGFLLEPFLTAAKANPDLVNLGDPAAWLPQRTPSAGLFTSAATLSSKSDLIDRFKSAFAKAIVYGNAHLDEVRADGAKDSGTSTADAQLITLDPIPTTAPVAADFDPLLQAMQDYGWTPKKIDITGFLGQ